MGDGKESGTLESNSKGDSDLEVEPERLQYKVNARFLCAVFLPNLTLISMHILCTSVFRSQIATSTMIHTVQIYTYYII